MTKRQKQVLNTACKYSAAAVCQAYRTANPIPVLECIRANQPEDVMQAAFITAMKGLDQQQIWTTIPSVTPRRELKTVELPSTKYKELRIEYEKKLTRSKDLPKPLKVTEPPKPWWPYQPALPASRIDVKVRRKEDKADVERNIADWKREKYTTIWTDGGAKKQRVGGGILIERFDHVQGEYVFVDVHVSVEGATAQAAEAQALHDALKIIAERE